MKCFAETPVAAFQVHVRVAFSWSFTLSHFIRKVTPPRVCLLNSRFRCISIDKTMLRAWLVSDNMIDLNSSLMFIIKRKYYVFFLLFYYDTLIPKLLFLLVTE